MVYYMISTLEDRLAHHFTRSGWKVHALTKVRGLYPDLVASRNGKIAMIEAKGSKGNIDLGLEQAMHFKNSADYSYLALPEGAVTKKLPSLCRSLGIGLLSVGEEVKTLVEPEESEALESVKNRIFSKKKMEKPEVQIRASLGRLFRSENLILILKLLFWHSTASFHSNDISRRTGLSPSTVSKELHNILSLGLVLKTTRGNLVLYQINSQSVIYNELRQIFVKFEFVDQLVAKDLAGFDIKFALIFGSFARGAETESSDVDLLIVGDAPQNLVLGAVSDIEGSIGREINAIVWREEEFYQKAKNGIALVEEIVKNPVIMITGDRDEFTRSGK
ncbi:MAG: nucleotidyltransferase domain-containing protein [Thaumarchaeota archaeon]|nr:nucleotidyltransferase domain-containing protein [Nitrososphaerota archaeon]